jgi:hypothetical protein
LLQKTINIRGKKFMSFTIDYKREEIKNILLPMVIKLFENEKLPILKSDNPELGIILYIFNKAGYKIKRKRVKLTDYEKTYEYNVQKI